MSWSQSKRQVSQESVFPRNLPVVLSIPSVKFRGDTLGSPGPHPQECTLSHFQTASGGINCVCVYLQTPEEHTVKRTQSSLKDIQTLSAWPRAECSLGVFILHPKSKSNQQGRAFRENEFKSVKSALVHLLQHYLQ